MKTVTEIGEGYSGKNKAAKTTRPLTPTINYIREDQTYGKEKNALIYIML